MLTGPFFAASAFFMIHSAPCLPIFSLSLTSSINICSAATTYAFLTESPLAPSLTAADLLRWEARHGPLPEGGFVALHTG